MKIAFTGTVSTGKTTLATEINKKYPELQLCTNLARSYMVNYGLKLNTESTDDTQIIFNKLFENFSEKLFGDVHSGVFWLNSPIYILYHIRR